MATATAADYLTNSSASTTYAALSGATFPTDGTVTMYYPIIGSTTLGNTRIGTNALQNSVSASAIGNTAIGGGSLYTNISGDRNTAVGEYSGFSTTSSDSTFIGHQSGRNTTGSFNTFLGSTSGSAVTTGGNNVIIGSNSGSTIATLSNNILFSDGSGNIRAQYLSASSGWTLGTVVSGTWNGTEIATSKGGTGLTTLGTAGQVLRVNAGGTAIEWGTASGGSSFTNSSELAALISDETGSGSAVFAISPTLTTPVISGGTINNASIGATTASTGKFTSININGQAIMEGSTGTSSATSSFDTTTHSSAEFIVYGSTSTGNYVSKVLMLARGTATPVITEYAILTQGTAPTVTITPSYSAPNAVLTVAVTSGTNIEIISTEVSI
jgi:hypothetical protein